MTKIEENEVQADRAARELLINLVANIRDRHSNQQLDLESADPDLDLDPISINQLTDYIEQALLETPELQQVWVSGEVSSASVHISYRSGVGRYSAGMAIP